MFKGIFATLSCAFWAISCLLSVICATDAHAQQANFTKFLHPIPLPAMIVQDPSGKDIVLKQLISNMATNGVVLLHLWSPSCGICIPEIRNIDKAKDMMAAKGMPVLSLAQDPRGKFSVPAFIKRQNIGSDGIYIDADLRAMRQLRAPGVPVTYIVSKSGQVLAMHQGAMSW